MMPRIGPGGWSGDELGRAVTGLGPAGLRIVSRLLYGLAWATGLVLIAWLAGLP